jgi:hypothetical protein
VRGGDEDRGRCAEAGRDVLRSGCPEGSDGVVASGGHRAGRVAGPYSRGVLGEGGVADMVQGLDLPVVTDEPGQLGWGGLLGGQAGDGVDRLDSGLACLAVGPAALDLDGLAGSGEEEVVHRGDLDPADLRAPVADAFGAALKRDVLPGKGLELSAELLVREGPLIRPGSDRWWDRRIPPYGAAEFVEEARERYSVELRIVDSWV